VARIEVGRGTTRGRGTADGAHGADGDASGPGRDGDVGAGRADGGDRLGCGVAVAVVASGARDGQARADPAVEARDLGPGAVVRHGRDVGGQPRGVERREARLGGGPDVAEGQQRQRRPGNPHDESGVVDRRAVPGGRGHRVGDVLGPQHGHPELADVGDPAGADRSRREPRGGGEGEDVRGAGCQGRAVPHPVHRGRGQDSPQATGVVGVEVGDDQQRHPAHPGVGQAPGHRLRLGTGVDDHGRSLAVPHQQRLPLAHVAHDDGPVVRDP
jgi:hypothetical protein